MVHTEILQTHSAICGKYPAVSGNVTVDKIFNKYFYTMLMMLVTILTASEYFSRDPILE